MQEPKLETIFGTFIKLRDVENPDELLDPSDYYYLISLPEYQQGYEGGDQGEEGDDFEGGEDDGGIFDWLGDLF